jgi:hypothetical protein
MATGPDPHPEPGPEAGIDELQADIEKTRAELGETVGALSDKLDVKARAQHTIVEARESVKARPAVPVGAMLAVVAGVGLLIWLRRR